MLIAGTWPWAHVGAAVPQVTAPVQVPFGSVPDMQVLRVSSLTGLGIAGVWSALERYQSALTANGELVHRRGEQNRSWLWDEVREQMMASLHHDPLVAALETEVVAGRRTPTSAADALLARWTRPS